MTVKQAFAKKDDTEIVASLVAVTERLVETDLESLPSVLKRTCDEVIRANGIPVDVSLKYLPECESIQVRVIGLKQ